MSIISAGGGERPDMKKNSQFGLPLLKSLMHRHETRMALLLASLLITVPACNQKMAIQPKDVPLRESEFYSNGMSARPLPDNTVPRGYLEDDAAFYTGKTAGGSPNKSAAPVTTTPLAGTQAASVEAPGSSAAQAANLAANVLPKTSGQSDIDYFPLPVTAEVLDRGQQRFNVFCAPCHSRLGDGQGMIVKRGFRAPPSFHIDRLRTAPVGHFFDVITNGFGAMPDYAQQVSPRDRWAIIAYIRALQLSQNATVADVPPHKRAELDTGGGSNDK
jgi:mono/diheme cytochrome c family protein